MLIKKNRECRICGAEIYGWPYLVNLGNQTLQGTFVYPNKPSPPTRAIPNIICRCYNCSLVQNFYTISPNILYSNYGYRSSISETMRNHLQDISDSIKGKIAEGSILDIGANDLFFLKTFPKTKFKRVGVDPCDIINEVDKDEIEVINDTFPTLKLLNNDSLIFPAHRQFDVITSIACFYDVDDPVNFASKVWQHLKQDGIWVLEVAYLPAVLQNLAYDGMVHEHLCLYSLDTLERVMEEASLRVFQAIENDTNGGSLQVWVCRSSCKKYDTEDDKANVQKLRLKEFELKLDEDEIYTQFRERVEKHGKALKNLINDLVHVDKKTVHVYGMSTKLNTILQYCNIGPELIQYAAERTPQKWGAKTISGIQMISEEESRAMKPDYYLVGPYFFKNEIIKREEQSILNGIEFIMPLPEIKIINKMNYKQFVD